MAGAYPRDYIENQHMLGENRLPARSLLLPTGRRGVTHKNFTASDRVRLLSGEWKFRWLPEDTAEPFYLPEADDGGWDVLPVPSMWQFHGYGSCYYPNVRYCFPYDPPYIHRENPVGLYRTTFTVKKSARSILRFLGVDNAFFVWLNGTYVGFSKGSRIPAEFDVSAALRDGENLLAVKVYTFSDASYLENQDMLMASGIFRDVMLISTGENALWDAEILPGADGFAVAYRCTVGKTPGAIRFTLCNADGRTEAEAERPLAEADKVFLPLKNAVCWNAEQPYLYTLYTEILENGDVIETHTKRCGIAKSEIRGSRLLMNGAPITLKGVNRHENNAESGRAVTAEQIDRELRDIKAHNLNAIRASHYTNHPLFYELCSDYGIYVMDEADAETHGAECTGDQGALNKDEGWFDAFFDRVERMYAINKNETCINIWSLGNECGGGANAERCVEWLSAQAVKKPIKDNNAPDCGGGLFNMTGYMPMQTLLDSDPEKGPLLLVEYGHAMGNSPGGLEDIWNWIYENEHCCGGYVWEYKSHGFYVKGRNGRPRYLYGGDFPDFYHWSNFSLDGYHRSDGTPKPSWEELGEVSAPVYVRWEADGVRVKNTYDFRTLDGVTLHWSVRADGAAVRSGSVRMDGLAARQWRRVPLPLETDGLCGLITADCVFTRGADVLAHKQKILADLPQKKQKAAPFGHTVLREGRDVTVDGGDFTVTIRNGLLTTLKKDGKTLLDAPVRLCCHRAPTDNDGAIFPPNHADEWNERLVHTMRFGCYDVRVDDAPEAATVTATGKFLPHSHFWGFNATLVYRILAGGEVEIGVDLRPYGRHLPGILGRVGMVLTLDAGFRRCRWLGRGPGENYADCKANAPVGIYEADVEDLHFAYDVPQETGNHGDCRFITVTGAPGALTVEGAFSFSYHNFTLENLTSARHCDELETSERNYLYIDHRQRGLGSHSCGPEPEKAYELPLGSFRWTYSLKPGERA